jgi:hypothetical protein
MMTVVILLRGGAARPSRRPRRGAQGRPPKRGARSRAESALPFGRASGGSCCCPPQQRRRRGRRRGGRRRRVLVAARESRPPRGVGLASPRRGREGAARIVSADDDGAAAGRRGERLVRRGPSSFFLQAAGGGQRRSDRARSGEGRRVPSDDPCCTRRARVACSAGVIEPPPPPSFSWSEKSPCPSAPCLAARASHQQAAFDPQTRRLARRRRPLARRPIPLGPLSSHGAALPKGDARRRGALPLTSDRPRPVRGFFRAALPRPRGPRRGLGARAGGAGGAGLPGRGGAPSRSAGPTGSRSGAAAADGRASSNSRCARLVRAGPRRLGGGPTPSASPFFWRSFATAASAGRVRAVPSPVASSRTSSLDRLSAGRPIAKKGRRLFPRRAGRAGRAGPDARSDDASVRRAPAAPAVFSARPARTRPSARTSPPAGPVGRIGTRGGEGTRPTDRSEADSVAEAGARPVLPETDRPRGGSRPAKSKAGSRPAPPAGRRAPARFLEDPSRDGRSEGALRTQRLASSPHSQQSSARELSVASFLSLFLPSNGERGGRRAATAWWPCLHQLVKLRSSLRCSKLRSWHNCLAFVGLIVVPVGAIVVPVGIIVLPIGLIVWPSSQFASMQVVSDFKLEPRVTPTGGERFL